jgi:hypothetical protein
MLRNNSGPTPPRGAAGKFGVSLLPNMNAPSATLPFRSEHRILSEEVRQFESNPPSDRSCAADVLSSSCLPGSDYKLEVKDNIDPDCVCYINKDSAKRTFQANIQVMTLSNAPVTDQDVRFILKPTLAYRAQNTTDLGTSFAVEGVLNIITPMEDLTLSAEKQEVCLEYQFTAISASCGNWPFAIHIHVDVICKSKTITTLGPYCTAAISVRTKELGQFPKPKDRLPLLVENSAANPTVLSTYKLEVSDYGDRTNEIDKNNNVLFYNKKKQVWWSTSVNLLNLVPRIGDDARLDSTLVLHCHLVYGDYPGEKVEFKSILQIKVDGQKIRGDSYQISMAPGTNTLKLTFRFDVASCNCHNRPFAIVIGGTYVLDGQNYSVAPARTPSTLVKTESAKRKREESAIASLGAGASEPVSASLPAGAARRLKSRKAKKVRMSDPHCSIFSPPAMPPRSPSLIIEPAMDSSVNEASRSRFLNELSDEEEWSVIGKKLPYEEWREYDILLNDDMEFLVENVGLPR